MLKGHDVVVTAQPRCPILASCPFSPSQLKCQLLGYCSSNHGGQEERKGEHLPALATANGNGNGDSDNSSNAVILTVR